MGGHGARSRDAAAVVAAVRGPCCHLWWLLAACPSPSTVVGTHRRMTVRAAATTRASGDRL